MSKIVIPLAEGFEEIEAVTSIDVLRRAEIEVVTVSLGDLKVTGANEITIEADQSIDQITSTDLTGIILPGGMPGAVNLREDERVINLIQELADDNKLIAAICAAPIVLEEAGVLKDKEATSYPGFKPRMKSCKYQEDRVVIDDNLITGRGPGVALEFVLTIVKYLANQDAALELKEAMLTNF
ncbi:DJ-1/PfpI family protein [Natroniella sulfidigena]|uniref:DJ-1 family glyoxalase III n=1 Tax=Natroniella sulfidigena TaxID=723921 RepID=UPI00200B828C|nr:DJ-1 family glyoxalase III [Natroniella sulfidigena]MCK8817261.1 DJ-1/PfpI family protein [Natroniella sulfidigena]